MEIFEIIDTSPMFENEISAEYYVIYEEILNRNISFLNNRVVEKERRSEKSVNIFKGNGSSSLKRINGFVIENKYSVDEVRNTIRNTYPEVFK